jgi:hypothetical protein
VNVGDHITCCIDDFEAGKIGSSMMHACAAVDGTVARRAGSTSRKKFTALVREYHWLVEAMGRLPNLDETFFSYVGWDKVPRPDFAEVIYKYHRCQHAHGQEPPFGFELLPGVGLPASNLVFGKEGVLQLPDNVIFALAAIAVLDPSSVGLSTPPGYHLSLGDYAYMINDWWGRADDFVAETKRNKIPRVSFGDLSFDE